MASNPVLFISIPKLAVAAESALRLKDGEIAPAVHFAAPVCLMPVIGPPAKVSRLAGLNAVVPAGHSFHM